MPKHCLRFKNEELASFLKQMGMLLEAGLPLSSVLNLTESRFPRISIRTRIEQGVPLAGTLKEMGVPAALVNLIEAGENSGQLEASLKLAALNLEKSQELKSRIIQSLTYPALVLLTSLLCLAGLIFFILPSFSTLFEGNGFQMPLLTRLIMALPDNSLWGIIMLAALIASIIYILKNDPLRLRIPVLGRIYQALELSRCLTALGYQLNGSASLLLALSASLNMGDHNYQKAREGIIRSIENGESLNRTLAKWPALFPPTLLEMVAVGEETGRLGEMILKAAEHYQLEAESRIKQATLYIEPASTLLVGSVVGVIAFAMMLPLYSMVNSLL